jgi:hypothetical protein
LIDVKMFTRAHLISHLSSWVTVAGFGFRAVWSLIPNSASIQGKTDVRQNRRGADAPRDALGYEADGKQTCVGQECHRILGEARQRAITATTIPIGSRSGSQVRSAGSPKPSEIRRRAAVEPVIGHLKDDHRMRRNHFKGRGASCYRCSVAAVQRRALLSPTPRDIFTDDKIFRTAFQVRSIRARPH